MKITIWKRINSGVRYFTNGCNYYIMRYKSDSYAEIHDNVTIENTGDLVFIDSLCCEKVNID